ncbi:stage VI sporulation protein D [Metabacillus fastidiosus]|uniref:stage VI sporulation protein D n=1 Tax=Metabacillus fastidiosus TaxID=1458 RepID=UPI003D2DA136
MPQEEQQLRFSIEESVWFQKGQEVSELLSISLDPDISIHEHDQYVSIRGALLLMGEYKIDEQAEEEVNFFEYGNMRYVNEIITTEDGVSLLSHRFPVDITVPREKIRNLNEVFVTIESFDYDLPEVKCLKLVADLAISGIIQEESVSKREVFSIEEDDEEKAELVLEGHDQEEKTEFIVEERDREEKAELVLEEHDQEEKAELVLEEHDREEKAEFVLEEHDRGEKAELVLKEHDREEKAELVLEERDREEKAELVLEEHDREEKAELVLEEHDRGEKAELIPAELNQEEKIELEFTRAAVEEENDKQTLPLIEEVKEKFNEEEESDDQLQSFYRDIEEEPLEEPDDSDREEENNLSLSEKIEREEIEQLVSSENLFFTATIEEEEESDEVFEIEVRKEPTEQIQKEQQEVQYSLLSQRDQPVKKEKAVEPPREEEPSSATSDNANYLASLFARDDEEDFSKLKICIVQQGETLDMICDRYDLTVQQIIRVNDFGADNDVYEGQILYIPAYSKTK